MDNILTISHLLELQRAGLDVDELSDMDWSDRFDTLLYAGLNPMDYDYGFLDDYNDEPAVPVKQVKRTSFFDMMLNDAARMKKPVKTAPKKMRRSERKRLEIIRAKALDDLETELMMFAEVMSDCF